MSDFVEIDIPVQYSFFGTAKRSRSADWRTARTTVRAPVRVLRLADAEGHASPAETAVLGRRTADVGALPVFDGAAYVPVLRRVSDDYFERRVRPVGIRDYPDVVADFGRRPTLHLELDPFGVQGATEHERMLNSEWKKKIVLDGSDVSRVEESDLERETRVALRAAERMAFVDGVLHTSRWEIVAACNDPVAGTWRTGFVDLIDPAKSLRSVHGTVAHVRFDKIDSVLPGVAVGNLPDVAAGRRFAFRDFDHLVAGAMHHFLSVVHPTSGSGAVVAAWSPNWPGLTEDLEDAVALCRRTLRRTIAAFDDPKATEALREEGLETLAACAGAVAAIAPARLGEGGVAAREALAAFLRHPGERWDRADSNWTDAPRGDGISEPADDAETALFSL